MTVRGIERAWRGAWKERDRERKMKEEVVSLGGATALIFVSHHPL